VVGPLQGRKAIVVKLGMDAHWRGAIVVANALKNAGMEVVYLGHASAAAIVNAVVQEDAVLLGMSSLSGNHLTECEPVVHGLRSAGAHDVAVVVGGTIPPRDEAILRNMGVDEIFTSGTPLPAIVSRISELVIARRRS
jgi:methylmalonyl-CoA mutase, C-terminal domain